MARLARTADTLDEHPEYSGNNRTLPSLSFDAHDVFLLLGLTVLWPFLTIATYVHDWAEPIMEMVDAGGVVHSFSMTYSLLLIVAFALILIFRRTIGPLLCASRTFMAVFGLAGAADTTILLIAGSLAQAGSRMSSALALFGVTLLAAFVATAIVGWGFRVMGDSQARGVARTIVIGLAASALARVIAVIYYCVGIDQSILFVIRPLLSALFIVLWMSNVGHEVGHDARQSKTNASTASAAVLPALRDLPWVAIIPIVVLLYVTSVVAQVLVGFNLGTMTLVGHIANAVAIIIVTVLFMVAVNRMHDMSDLLLAAVVVFVLGAAVLTLVFFVPALVDSATFVVRACLVTFLWVIFAYASAERRIPATVGFSAFGMLGVALMGVRLFDHAALIEMVATSRFGVQIVAVALFIAASAVVAVVGLRRRRLARTAAMDQVDWQRELCERATASAGLTAREAEVVYYTYRGYSARGVGEELGVSEYTIKNHLANAYRKLDVHSKQDLISYVDGFR